MNTQFLVMLVNCLVTLVSCLVTANTACVGQQSITQFDNTPVKSISLGQIHNLSCIDELFCSGQFTQADIPLLKEQKFERIISLRIESEIDWNEKSAVEQSGLEYLQIPIAGPADLTDEIFDRVRNELSASDKKTLLHCGIGARAAAVWLPYRVLNQKIELAQALKESQALGLTHSGMREAAVAYINRHDGAGQSASVPTKATAADEKQLRGAIVKNRTETTQSAKPGINADFLDPNLNVNEFVKRFEMESREIFVAREKILAACQLKKGMIVADIGAGTGLFSRLFSVSVGDQGWVFAIDISPRLLEHVNKESTRFGLTNISAVLCTDKSAAIPPASVDAVFVCDTYHHFEFPPATLASILEGMKPGASLMIVDFERIPGLSREWILDHVRADKQTVRGEIEAAGFEFVEELAIAGLQENYFLRFRKPLN
jgi:ubiquinone/menaquinone biosynthesis C-methylase UbiE/protein tyrosine phosphatase (PTP) superfamily phosphohydrolase (DUF442 family)